jgi:CRISPR-associated protein Csb1
MALSLEELLKIDGPPMLVIRAKFSPVGELERFQPAGFPEIGPVFYDRPVRDNGANRTEKICIVDSAASMANHLETVCLASEFDSGLHSDLEGLPYVVCETDGAATGKPRRTAFTSFREGHRLASDYFLDGLLDTEGDQSVRFREHLRKEFELVEIAVNKKYFTFPETWWSIFKTIFRYDPNSLVHGVLFAKEQIKISRVLSASLEAYGATRVGRSGVKFDRIGKTTSGQPIFAVEEETAREIVGTFIIDLALIRSYGRSGNGLNDVRKRLLLELALWKISRLTAKPFRFRSGCYLQCDEKTALPDFSIQDTIRACDFQLPIITKVYYPALGDAGLFKVKGDEKGKEKTAEDLEGEAEPEDADGDLA